MARCIVPMHHKASVGHAVYAHVHHGLALDRARPLAACFLTQILKMPLGLLFAGLALLQIRAGICRLVLLLSTPNTARAIITLLLGKLLLTQPLIRRGHLGLVVWSLALLRPWLLQFFTHIYFRSGQTDQSDLTLCIWTRR